jgi:hypothetical protein
MFNRPDMVFRERFRIRLADSHAKDLPRESSHILDLILHTV